MRSFFVPKNVKCRQVSLPAYFPRVSKRPLLDVQYHTVVLVERAGQLIDLVEGRLREAEHLEKSLRQHRAAAVIADEGVDDMDQSVAAPVVEANAASGFVTRAEGSNELDVRDLAFQRGHDHAQLGLRLVGVVVDGVLDGLGLVLVGEAHRSHALDGVVFRGKGGRTHRSPFSRASLFAGANDISYNYIITNKC